MELKRIIILLSILSIIIFTGCVKQKTRYVCPDGSTVTDSSLCLKQESNAVEAKKTEHYCGDGICNGNEKAPNCDDCNMDIRISNVQCDIVEVEHPYLVDDINFVYDVENLADDVYLYPSVTLYAGWSSNQCSSKNRMSYYKDWDCPGGCYFLLKEQINGKKYDDIAFGVNNPSQGGEIGDNPECFYFVFKLRSYPEGGVGKYNQPEPIDTWESGINPC